MRPIRLKGAWPLEKQELTYGCWLGARFGPRTAGVNSHHAYPIMGSEEETKMSHINRRSPLNLVGATATLGMLRPSGAEHAEDDETPQRTFVLTHGAWHTGAAWDEVARRLRLAGHKVEAPTLPGTNPVNQGQIQLN